MKKIFCLLFILVLCVNKVLASQCFIAKEQAQIMYQEGDCYKRYAPCSTFKIALSLIGYDTGILIDEIHPKWPFKKVYVDSIDSWRQAQTPKSWMQNSCVWYSQLLTKQLGIKRLQLYINTFNYGNIDLTGDQDKNNGLTNAWLSSSLEISSIEQVNFLQNLLNKKLPISKYAQTMTRNLLVIENLPNGWRLYGKTGSGVLLSADRRTKLTIQHGWFVGWIEKDGRIIIFTNHITDEKNQDTYASLRAKADARQRLVKIISTL